MSLCKESNKLVGTANFLEWKKRTDLNLIENEVMEHVKGSITKPPKEDDQALARYMKGEVRTQRILIESIKDPLIPYVREVISLRQELYKLRISKEEGIASYFMRISEIRDQLQDLGEIMSNKEMTTIVLNVLVEEWGNFTSSIYGKKEATPFKDLWSLCKIEETRLKAKLDVGWNEQTQLYVLTAKKRKGKFGKFGLHKRKKSMAKVQCYGCQEYGHFKRNCPKLKDNSKRGREEAHITE
eukprot:PITA_09693